MNQCNMLNLNHWKLIWHETSETWQLSGASRVDEEAPAAAN
jgi:hypothetical protein